MYDKTLLSFRSINNILCVELVKIICQISVHHTRYVKFMNCTELNLLRIFEILMKTYLITTLSSRKYTLP